MKLIPLTQGKFAQVDDEDFEYLNNRKWHTYESSGNYYARRYDKVEGRWMNVKMHRLLLDAKDGVSVDHIDGNGLNNQKDNIRLCTVRENNLNRKGRGSSKYLGVSFDKEANKWRARINTGISKINIGRFSLEENAAIAYNIYAEKHHGEFARYNTVNT